MSVDRTMRVALLEVACSTACSHISARISRPSLVYAVVQSKSIVVDGVQPERRRRIVPRT